MAYALTGKSINGQLVLEERVLEYKPTKEEIDNHASDLGIDIDRESHLLWIATESLNAPLPDNWKAIRDPKSGDNYYFNFNTGESIWHHPADDYYADMVRNERDKLLLAEMKKKKKKELKKSSIKHSNDMDTKLTPMISPLKAANTAVSKELTMKPLRDLNDHKMKHLQQHEAAYMPGLLQSSIKHTTFNSIKGDTTNIISGESGPRLSNDSLMRISAENYLKGSTESYMLGGPLDTHSSLRSGSLGLELDLTSSMDQGHVKLIDMDSKNKVFDDDEGDNPYNKSQGLENRFNIDIHDMVELGYNDSDEASELVPRQTASSATSTDGFEKDLDFGLDRSISERISGLNLLRPTSNELELSSQSKTTSQTTERAEPTGRSLSVAPINASLNTTIIGKDNVSVNKASRESDGENISNINDINKMEKNLYSDLQNKKNLLIENNNIELEKLKVTLEKEKHDKELSMRKENSKIISVLKNKLEKDKENEIDDCEIILDKLKIDNLSCIEKLKRENSDKLNELKIEYKEDIINVYDEIDQRKKEAKIHKELEEKIEIMRNKMEIEYQNNIEDFRKTLSLSFEENKHIIEIENTKKIKEYEDNLNNVHQKELLSIKKKLLNIHKSEVLSKEFEINKAEDKHHALAQLENELEDKLISRKKKLLIEHQIQINEIETKHASNIEDMEDSFKKMEIEEGDHLKNKFESSKLLFHRNQDKDLEKMKKEIIEKENLLIQKNNDNEQKINERKHELNRKSNELREKELALIERQNEHLRNENNYHFNKKSVNNEDSLKKLEEMQKFNHQVSVNKGKLEELIKQKCELSEEVKQLRVKREQAENEYSETLNRITGLTIDTDLSSKCHNVMNTSRIEGEGDRVNVNNCNNNDTFNAVDRCTRCRHIAWKATNESSSSTDEEYIFNSYKVKHRRNETSTTLRAREFLNDQKKCLKNRQQNLNYARHELDRDKLRQQLGVLPTASSTTLLNVKTSLDFEEVELSRIKEKMKLGIELLNAKEVGLKELSRIENSNCDSQYEDSSDESIEYKSKDTRNNEPMTDSMKLIIDRLNSLDNKIHSVMQTMNPNLVPDTQTKNVPMQSTPIFQHSTNLDSNYLRNHRPCLATDMENKWLKYFGDTTVPINRYEHPFINLIPIRTQFEMRKNTDHSSSISQRMNYNSNMGTVSQTTKAMLAEQRDWLKRFDSRSTTNLEEQNNISHVMRSSEQFSEVNFENNDILNEGLGNKYDEAVHKLEDLKRIDNPILKTIRLEIDENGKLQRHNF